LDRDLKIGDVIPLADGQSVDRRALGYIKASKTRAATMAARATEGAARNQVEARARVVASADAEIKKRLTDPYQQACAFLQRRGYVVYDGRFCSPPRKGVVVGRNLLPTEKAVIAYAEALGWERVKSP
jgi:hypothetical protein